MFPLARSENLTVQELPEEVVVFDMETNKVHCLNQASALIWKFCNGRTSIDQLAKIISRELHITSPAAVVQLSLEQLSNRGLLQAPLNTPSGKDRISRREALKKLVAAGVCIPAILTITAPKAMAQASFFRLCQTDSDCPSDHPCQLGRCTQNTVPAGTVFSCTFVPAADGTPCGTGMACLAGACVPVVTPPPPPPPPQGPREPGPILQ